MKNFCLDLKEHATKIINYENKEIIPLTKEEEKIYCDQKVCYKCQKGFSIDDDSVALNGVTLNKKYNKVRDRCHYTGKYRGAAHNICNFRFKAAKEIPAVFHNGSAYDYHFLIKEQAEEFKGQFKCFGENAEKYISLSVPIKKQITKIDKDGNDKIVDISYKIKFIHRFRFKSCSLSKIVDNLSERLHSNKCTDRKFCHDYMSFNEIAFKDNQLTLKYLKCNKNYNKDFNKELIKRFVNTYEFCNKDTNKFISLLRKGVYPYEYTDSWERFDETSLPDKRAFYRSLNMENISGVDYRHANKIFKEFKLKNLGDYHDLYVQSDT